MVYITLLYPFEQKVNSLFTLRVRQILTPTTEVEVVIYRATFSLENPDSCRIIED